MKAFINLLTVSLAIILAGSPVLTYSENKSTQNGLVNLKYTNPVHGYFVSAIWKPWQASSNYVTGPAMVTFTRQDNHLQRTVSYNHFSVHKNRLPFSYNKDGNQISRFNCQDIRLTYQADKPIYKHDPRTDGTLPNFGAGTPDEPFFFKDVNFDGQKELVFAWPMSGQRWRVTYQVYALIAGENPFPYDIYHQQPLTSLDSGAVFDKSQKTITTNISGGACDSEYRTYQLTKDQGFVLKSISNYHMSNHDDAGHDQCTIQTYRMIKQPVKNKAQHPASTLDK